MLIGFSEKFLVEREIKLTSNDLEGIKPSHCSFNKAGHMVLAQGAYIWRLNDLYKLNGHTISGQRLQSPESNAKFSPQGIEPHGDKVFISYTYSHDWDEYGWLAVSPLLILYDPVRELIKWQQIMGNHWSVYDRFVAMTADADHIYALTGFEQSYKKTDDATYYMTAYNHVLFQLDKNDGFIQQSTYHSYSYLNLASVLSRPTSDHMYLLECGTSLQFYQEKQESVFRYLMQRTHVKLWKMDDGENEETGFRQQIFDVHDYYDHFP
jgi:hypothetical protein